MPYSGWLALNHHSSLVKLSLVQFSRKAVAAVPENAISQKPLDSSHSVEPVRLLWEGTRQAIEHGIDTEDLIALCGIIMHLADHRLLRHSCTSSGESDEGDEQLRQYRKLASDLLQWASTPAPEPD